MNLQKLHLGCGKSIYPGYINLDIVKGTGVDVVHNLEVFPYPFKSEQFEIVEAHQVLEHIHNLDGLMKEVARILKKGGKFKIDVPHFSSNSAFMDPTHCRFFAFTTFDFYVKGHFNSEGYEYSTQHFSRIRRRLRFYKGGYFWNYLVEPFVNVIVRVGNGHLYEANFMRSLFPAWRVEVELIK